jgi:hypothetical protein
LASLRGLSREIDQIAAAIPNQDFAIQSDACIELVFVLEEPEIAKQFPVEMLVGSIAHASSHVPADAELGLHLCYGDRGHKQD